MAFINKQRMHKHALNDRFYKNQPPRNRKKRGFPIGHLENNSVDNILEMNQLRSPIENWSTQV